MRTTLRCGRQAASTGVGSMADVNGEEVGGVVGGGRVGGRRRGLGRRTRWRLVGGGGLGRGEEAAGVR